MMPLPEALANAMLAAPCKDPPNAPNSPMMSAACFCSISPGDGPSKMTCIPAAGVVESPPTVESDGPTETKSPNDGFSGSVACAGLPTLEKFVSWANWAPPDCYFISF